MNPNDQIAQHILGGMTPAQRANFTYKCGNPPVGQFFTFQFDGSGRLILDIMGIPSRFNSVESIVYRLVGIEDETEKSSIIIDGVIGGISVQTVFILQ